MIGNLDQPHWMSLQHKYFKFADETDFMLDCSRMAEIPTPTVQPYLIEQFEKIGLNIDDIPIVPKKNYSISQVFKDEIKRVKQENYTITPYENF